MRRVTRAATAAVAALLVLGGWAVPAQAADGEFSMSGYAQHGSDLVPGIVVEAVEIRADGSVGEVVASTVTDASGRYLLRTPARDGVVVDLRTSDPSGRYVPAWGGDRSGPYRIWPLHDQHYTELLFPQAVGRYVPVDPVRVLDTREDEWPVGPGERFLLELQDVVPDGATAAVLNLTTTRTTCTTSFVSSGFLWDEELPPPTSVVNARGGADVANLVTVPLRGPQEALTLYNDQCDTDLVADLQGYYVPSAGDARGAGYTPVVPTRVLDTREAARPLGPRETRRVDLAPAGSGLEVPEDAVAVAVNVTATAGTAVTSYVSAFASGDPEGSSTSVLNAYAGRDIANSAVVPLAEDGTIEVYSNSGSQHLVLDVQGWYTAEGGVSYWPIAPRRTASATAPPLGAGQERVAGADLGNHLVLPADAAAVALNLTTTAATARTSFVTAYPDGATRPWASNVNTRQGVDLANGAVVALGPGYRLYNAVGQVRVLEDVYGWFAPSALD